MYGSPDLSVEARANGRATYSITVTFILPARNNRFFAIPVIGYLARLMLLIPHFVVLALIGMAVAFSQLVLWAPVLFAGRYPRWGYDLVGGYFRWYVRVMAYMYGLTDDYPPFRLSN
jgi:hypothetical protein